MGQDSAIEWTHHTFNPWRGCTKISDGCKHCYADTLSKRNPGALGVWGPNGERVAAAESYWREPIKWAIKAASSGERHRVFCASLADVGEGRDTMPTKSWDVVQAARRRLQDVIRMTASDLDWLLLTKRPENMPALYDRDVLEMCWVGASVENQKAADERIPWLKKIPAKVLFLSMEPLLGPVDLGLGEAGQSVGPGNRRYISWVIVGGESGANARPMHPRWAKSLRDQCVAAGVAFHFKQWGEWLPISDAFPQHMTAPQGDVWYERENDPDDLPVLCYRVGKKAAGRMLDDQTWDEFPTPAGVTNG